MMVSKVFFKYIYLGVIFFLEKIGSFQESVGCSLFWPSKYFVYSVSVGCSFFALHPIVGFVAVFNTNSVPQTGCRQPIILANQILFHKRVAGKLLLWPNLLFSKHILFHKQVAGNPLF